MFCLTIAKEIREIGSESGPETSKGLGSVHRLFGLETREVHCCCDTFFFFLGKKNNDLSLTAAVLMMGEQNDESR